MPASSRVLLVSEDTDLSRYLREELIVNAGCAVSFESDADDALASYRDDHFDVVLVSYDVGGGGFEGVIKSFKKLDPDAVIVVFVEQATRAAMDEIIKLGVYDILHKPVNLEKLFFLAHKGAELHGMLLAQRKLGTIMQEQNSSLQKQNTLLAKRIEESTRNLTRLYEDLRTTYMRTIRVLAQAIDARDHYTHSHSENVSRIAVEIGTELGLSAKDLEILREASELHDVGKIGISDSILMKPAKLDQQEWEQIRKHPQIGAQILEPLTFLNTVIDMVRQHHEHWDGSGYPDGRKGEDILLGARILHVADAYEAMTSARSYRQVPLTKEVAVQEIRRNNGTQFDPKVVDAFMKVVDRL